MVITESTQHTHPSTTAKRINDSLLLFFFSVAQIDLNRFGPGGPSGEERPITTGHVNREAWITGLVDYVNSMKQICPDVIYPPDDWLSQGFSMLSSDWGNWQLLRLRTRVIPLWLNHWTICQYSGQTHSEEHCT